MLLRNLLIGSHLIDNFTNNICMVIGIKIENQELMTITLLSQLGVETITSTRNCQIERLGLNYVTP